MQKINNIKKLYDRRKELRNNSTKEEILLWQYLKHSKLLGFKFRRQHSIGGYVVDFYCPLKKLAIELDGAQHIENYEYDIERTRYLNELGINVLRFWNNEINVTIDSVIKKITDELQ